MQNSLHGEVRGFRPPPGLGVASLSTHECHGLLAGGQHWGSTGCGLTTGGGPGSGGDGRGEVRPSCTLDFAGGPSLNNLCQQAAKQSVEGSRLHAPPQQLFPSGIGGDCRLHASGC